MLEGPFAFVVLGCRVRAAGAMSRRVTAAARAWAQRGDAAAIVVASGGRRWGGEVEADAMARELLAGGVPEGAIVRERCSLSTRENARYCAALLGKRGIDRAAVVTCAWHVPRAIALFWRAGVAAEGIAAEDGDAPWAHRAWRWGRERVLEWAQTR